MARLLLRDLTPGTNYKLQIRAVEGDSTSEWSRLFSLTTIIDQTPPDTPAWAVANGWVVDGDTFVATWQPVNSALNQNKDLDHYEVELSNGTKTVVVPTTDTTYTLTFDQNRIMFGSPSPTVLARIRSVDATRNASAWGTQRTVTNPAPAAPTAPAVGSIATAGVSSIELSWTPPADLDLAGYRVYVGAVDTFVPAAANRIFSGNTTKTTYYTLSTTKQYFKIRAVDKFNQESPDLTANATAQSTFVIDATPPSAPTGFGVTISDDPNGILLTQTASATWTPVTGDASLAGYHIRFKESGTTDWAVVAAPADVTFPFIVSKTLEPNKPYDFEVRSYDIAANKSAWVALSTNAKTPTVIPTLISALTIGGGGYIQSQNFAGGATGFKIDEDSIEINNGDIRGQAITSGLIRSNQPAIDATGAVITGEYAWQINIDGNAVLGDVKVRGSIVMGQQGETQLSRIQTYNYVPGATGYAFFSDGTADLRALGADSISGKSIIANTLSPGTLDDGTLSSEITLNGSLVAHGAMGETVTMGGAGFSVYGPYTVSILDQQISNGVATLTTVRPHGFVAGGRLVVSGAGAAFDGDFIIATVPTPTTLTYATTSANVAVAPSTGTAQGLDVTNTGDAKNLKPRYVEFPTDGARPNIISGTLAADTLTVSKGASLRGVSGIEYNSTLTIASAILAPKSPPTVTTGYTSLQVTGFSQLFGETNPATETTAVCYGKDGKLYSVSDNFGSGSSYIGKAKIMRHDPVTGMADAVLAEIVAPTKDSIIQPLSIIWRPNGTTGGTYYVLTVDSVPNANPTLAKYDAVLRTYDNNWTLLSTTVMLHTTDGGDLTHNSPYGAALGWDFVNGRLMFARSAINSNAITLSYHSIDATTGQVITQVATSTLSGTNYGHGLGMITRVNLSVESGTVDRIIFRLNNPALSSWMVIDPATNTLKTAEQWPVASSYAQALTSTDGKTFYDYSLAGLLTKYESGDSWWTTSDNGKRWVSYTWVSENGSKETDISPAYSLTLPKRSRMFVTIGNIPYDNTDLTGNSPKKSYVYVTQMGQGLTVAPPDGSVYWHRSATINYPETVASIDPARAVGAVRPPGNTFLSGGTPGIIKSTSGMSYWKGDDTAQFYALKVRGGKDVDALWHDDTDLANLPPLRIRDLIGKQEMRMDGNEIQVLTVDDVAKTVTPSTLILNQGGGKIQLGAGGRSFTTFRMGNYRGNSTGSGTVVITHGIVDGAGNPVAPNFVMVSTQQAGPARLTLPQSASYTPTTFTVSVQNSAGTGLNNVVADFDWIAMVL